MPLQEMWDSELTWLFQLGHQLIGALETSLAPPIYPIEFADGIDRTGFCETSGRLVSTS
jgi:hypothetical protein